MILKLCSSDRLSAVSAPCMLRTRSVTHSKPSHVMLHCSSQKSSAIQISRMCHPPNQKYTSLPACRRDLTSQTRPTLKNIFCYIVYPILRAACLHTNFSQWNYFLVYDIHKRSGFCNTMKQNIH